MDWKIIARTLRIGTKRKVVCCSADPSATISNGHSGIQLYCHRCHRKEYIPHGPRSLAEILATRQATDALANQTTPRMPADAVPVADGPREAWQWVLKGGLSPEQATDTYGMRWSESIRRVLIPIYTPTGAMTALIGRAVFGERPKYQVIHGTARTFYRAPGPMHPVVVVVEDILSAIAVSRTGVSAVAVLGTAITPEHAAEISKGAAHVIGWFDGDAAGDAAWTRLRPKISLYPVKLSRIRTQEDPKALHRQRLQAVITEHIGTQNE